MGSGKTTVGRVVAERSRARFVDLDERLELIFGRSIADIVRAGEPRFRRLERAVLLHLLDDPGFTRDEAWVVATGGGVVTDPRNMEAMKGAGTVVYLDVPVAEIARRVGRDPTRPLLDGADDPAETLGRLLDARRSAYEAAHRRVDGRGTPHEVAGRVVQAWRTARTAAE